MKRYYLLAFANFLAAIGGGAILSSGFKSIKDFPEAAVVAFFIGAVIGLFFQLLVPESWSRSIAPWFSVGVGPVSLILAGLFKVYADDGVLHGTATYFFIALLSVRFGLWFFSRALRAQTAGSRRQGIALIELGYYSGMVFGLLVHRGSKYGLVSALLVDAMLQPIAGLIDLANADGRKTAENTPADLREVEESPRASIGDGRAETDDKIPFDNGWYWRLTAAVVCLTIGFQAVIFSIRHNNELISKDEMSAYILACFYGGVALAALFCRTFQIKFDWRTLDGNAMISSELTGIRLKANFGLITLLAAISLITALLGSGQGQHVVSVELPFIAAAAFIYQILVLSLLDRIGKAEKFARLNVKLTYLILGVGTVMTVLALSVPAKNHAACIIVTLACSLISFYVVRRRTVAHA